MIDFYREFPDAWGAANIICGQPLLVRGAENVIPNTSLSFTLKRKGKVCPIWL
ncbi:MAG: hypothetical protein ABFD25_11215 [Clostridiaceae bacterium]